MESGAGGREADPCDAGSYADVVHGIETDVRPREGPTSVGASPSARRDGDPGSRRLPRNRCPRAVAGRRPPGTACAAQSPTDARVGRGDAWSVGCRLRIERAVGAAQVESPKRVSARAPLAAQTETTPHARRARRASRAADSPRRASLGTRRRTVSIRSPRDHSGDAERGRTPHPTSKTRATRAACHASARAPRSRAKQLPRVTQDAEQGQRLRPRRKHVALSTNGSHYLPGMRWS